MFVKTKVELGKKLGVNRKTIDRWLKLPDAPKAKSDGRLDVKAWQEFIRKTNLKEDDAPDLLALKCRRLKTQCDRADFEFACQKREFIHQDEMRRTFTRYIVAAKAKLLALPSSVCQKLALMSDPVEVEQELKGKINEALSELQNSPWAKCECAKCGAEVC